MTDYVRDNTTLPAGKADGRPLTVPASQAIAAAEWNQHCAATDSVRAWLLGGDYHGLASTPTAPVAPADTIHLRNNANAFEISKAGRAYRPVEYVADVRDYGAVGGGADDTAAFAAAIAACPVGGVVYVPKGTWRMTAPLTLTEGITLRGEHPQYYGAATTILTWPAGVDGLVLGPGAGGRLGLCVVENLCIWALGKTTAAVGIRPLAKCLLRGLYVSGWKTNGIRLVGTTESPWPYANINGSRILDCAIDGSDGDGMYLTGSDCNAFLLSLVSSRSNGGYGFRDTTLTSGSYHQCHVEENTGGGYYCTNSGAGAMFIGCYAEGGQANHIAPPAQIVGGTGMESQNYTEAGTVAGRASAASGLLLGGGGGGAGSLRHVPILGGAAATWALDLTCAFLFPYLGADTTLSAVPAFSGLTYGQQFTIYNNTIYAFTIPDLSSAGNGVHLVGARSVTLRPGDAITFIALGASVVVEYFRSVAATSIPAGSAYGDSLVWNGTAWVAGRTTRETVTLAAGSSISLPSTLADAAVVELSTDLDVVSTATPLLPGGRPAQEVTLVNVGEYLFTITDEGTLPGSGVELASGTTVTLPPGGMLRLVASVDGKWVEVWRGL